MGMPNQCCNPPVTPTSMVSGRCRPTLSTGCAVEHKRLEALIRKETEDRKEYDTSSEEKLGEVSSKVDRIEGEVGSLSEMVKSIRIDGGEVVA